MPSLPELSAALGTDLSPASDVPLPDRPVTAVHVSELSDPTPYLEGGELLLTTGMSLTGHTAGSRAYAARLAARRVAALGLGLGPVHATVPLGLATACEQAGLPLLVVPAPTPFLAISRRYWSLLVEAGQEQLSTALGAHRDLVRAASGQRPVSAVVKSLASAVEGWAAQLTPEGKVVEVWPRDRRSVVRVVAGELDRLRAAGPHSSATLPVGGDDVVIQPLSAQGRLTGFVATGCPRPMKAPDRQLVLAACSLLALQHEQQRRGTAGPQAARGAVARLMLLGYPDAARALAVDLGMPAPASRLHVFGAAGLGTSGHDLLDHVEAALPRDRAPLLAALEPNEVWGLLPADDLAAARAALGSGVRDVVPGARVVVSREATTPELPLLAANLHTLLARTPEGVVRDLGDAPGSGAGGESAALDRLLAYTRTDLAGAVVAYLRHRGQWEGAAQELDVHRNTLRHRIGTARRVLQIELDDPDVASRLWLELRERGLA